MDIVQSIVGKDAELFTYLWSEMTGLFVEGSSVKSYSPFNLCLGYLTLPPSVTVVHADRGNGLGFEYYSGHIELL